MSRNIIFLAFHFCISQRACPTSNSMIFAARTHSILTHSLRQFTTCDVSNFLGSDISGDIHTDWLPLQAECSSAHEGKSTEHIARAVAQRVPPPDDPLEQVKAHGPGRTDCKYTFTQTPQPPSSNTMSILKTQTDSPTQSNNKHRSSQVRISIAKSVHRDRVTETMDSTKENEDVEYIERTSQDLGVP